jgi:hypothetical protein
VRIFRPACLARSSVTPGIIENPASSGIARATSACLARR